MDILVGLSILLALLVFVFIVMCGYASTIDRIALFLHRHAEQVRRTHAYHDEQMRTWWQAEWRRGRSSAPKEPISIQRERDRPAPRGRLSAAPGNSRL